MLTFPKPLCWPLPHSPLEAQAEENQVALLESSLRQCFPEPACWGSRDMATGPVFIWKLPPQVPLTPGPTGYPTGDTQPQSYEEMDRLTKGKQGLRSLCLI